MFEVIVFAVCGFKVEGFLGDEGGDVFVLFFLGRFGRFARHDVDVKNL